MELSKPAIEYTAAERQAMLRATVREVLSTMTPNVYGEKFSGQQIAYAKGRAWKQMREAGF